jgi:uncharacterized membrane protein
MRGSVEHVLIAAAVFLGLHVLPSTPARAALIRALGAGAYRGLFSLATALALAWLILAYAAAPVEPVWQAGAWARWLALAAMPLAFIFLVAGLTSANPMVAGLEGRVDPAQAARGFLTVTRHPFFVSFALWGLAHLLVKGDRASILFFGSIALLALAGMRLIDQRKAKDRGEAYAGFVARTSALPFLAAIEGRTAIDWRGMGWWRPALGLALFALALGGHAHIFRALPWPW